MEAPVEIPPHGEPTEMHAPSAVPEFSPLAGSGPDLELPLPVPAPSSFVPHLSSFPDRSQHHYDITLAEIDRLQARIDELKINLTRSPSSSEESAKSAVANS